MRGAWVCARLECVGVGALEFRYRGGRNGNGAFLQWRVMFMGRFCWGDKGGKGFCNGVLLSKLNKW